MKDVAFSCDNNGAKFLCVTVWSLLEHYKGDEPLRINVFEGFGGHSPESKAKLAAIVEEWNRRKREEVEKRGGQRCETSLPPPPPTFYSLRYHNVERFIEPYKDILRDRVGSRWNIFTWTPIFTPQILADAEGNVAHFDIDMLFNDDVSKILDLDLGENLIACVAEYGQGDPLITEAVWGKGILPPEAERYFNTGTIVFNTAKCREEKTWEKILAWYREHYDIADRIEQDAWNALYWQRTLLLPLRWNFHDRLVKSIARWDLRAKYWQGNPPKESLEAALNPAILHFWGPKKPWRPCHRPYRKLYHAAMTAVGQTPPKKDRFERLHDILTTAKKRRIVSKLRFLTVPYECLGERRARRQRLRQALLSPVEWLGIALALLIITPLSMRVLFGFCDVLSRIMYFFDRRGKRRALENLHIIRGLCAGDEGTSRFDPDQAPYKPTRAEELIIRRSYRNMARSVGYAFWTLVNAKARCRQAGEMSQAGKTWLAANKPAVTVSGHIGCWEILSQLAYLEGHTMMSVAKNIGTRGMTKLLMAARRSIGQEIVPADGAFKLLMVGIKAGKSLGLLVDQKVSPRKGGVWVRFLGKPMPVSAAPAFFAAKAKVPIVVAWSRPLRDGRYRCEIVDTISPKEARDIWGTTQRCAHDLERIVRRHPSCWTLNYNPFKKQPTHEVLEKLENV